MPRKRLLMIISWLWTCFLAVMLFIVATLPPEEIRNYPGAIDRLVKDGGHVLGFTLLTGSLYCSLGAAFGLNRTMGLTSALAGLMLALLTEHLQQYTPGRQPSLADVVLNTTGTLIGVTVVYWTSLRLNARFIEETTVSVQGRSTLPEDHNGG